MSLAMEQSKIERKFPSSTCVCSNVLLQRAKSSEHLLAFATFVRLVLAVHGHVHFEVSRACKTPAALGAFERLLP